VIGVLNVNFLQVLANDGNDRVEVNIPVATFIDGGAGDDTVLGSSLNDVVFGNAGNDVIDGRDGADILIGSNQNDVLIGGNSRDVLFGGFGADNLDGGADDDLLIAGPTTHENSFPAVLAILAEWTSNRTLQQRVANLSGTGVGDRNNGDVFLVPGSTMADDEVGAVDTLLGGGGLNWFIYQFGEDNANDFENNNDVQTDIAP